MTGRYLRQLGWYDPSQHLNDRVTFVGVGGIGSFAAFGAAKLGVPYVGLIDPDVVDEHNTPNQLYSLGQQGESKALALQETAGEHAPDVLVDAGIGWITSAGFEGTDRVGDMLPLRGAVVSGLDSMEARVDLWEQAVKLKPSVSLYIDARLGGQFMVMYALNPARLADCEAYERTLYSDEEAEDAPCTERGVIDVGLMIGSLITRALRLHFTNEEVPNITMMNQETLTVTQGGWVE